jgi:hypothetical protein
VREKYGPDLRLAHFPYGKWVVPTGLGQRSPLNKETA